MPFNGAGLFERVFNWVADRDAGVKIRADRMDAEFDGVATGLSNTICRDGQTTITADIPFNNHKITGLAAATASTDAARFGQLRERLTATRTYYVRTDGSNSNTGLANTAGGAFLTLQKAWDVVCDSIDLAGFGVTIQVGAGTYTTGVVSDKGAVGGTITIIGDTATPTNVVISTTGASCFALGNGSNGRSQVSISGFKLQTTTTGSAIEVYGGGCSVTFDYMNFGTCAYHHVHGNHGAFIIWGGHSYAVSGNAINHLMSQTGACVAVHGSTIVFSNSPAFSTASTEGFAVASDGTIYAAGMTFTNGGTVTGRRFYVATPASSINAGGVGLTYFPGSVAGAVGTNAVYDTTAGPMSATTLSLSGALTYGGVALNASVTGTGNMVLSANPTFTGTIACASGTFSSTLGVSGAATVVDVYFGSTAQATAPDGTSDTSKGGIRALAAGYIGIGRNQQLCGTFNRIGGDGGVFEFARSGTVVGSISVTTTLTAYNTTSDKDRKCDERPFARAREIIKRLKIWDFAWREHPEKRSVGVFAQDAYEVFPDAITPSEKKGGWEADYSKYVPVLIAGLQEAYREIDALKQTIADSQPK